MTTVTINDIDSYLAFRTPIEHLTTPALENLSLTFITNKVKSNITVIALAICSIAFLIMSALSGSLLIAGLSSLSLAITAAYHYRTSAKNNLKQKVLEDLFHERGLEVIFESKLGGFSGFEVKTISLDPQFYKKSPDR
jgi:hypothetical protein